LVENRDFFIPSCIRRPRSRGSRRSIAILFGTEQELSYRKQIARKLRTQYVDGNHRPKYYTVILKSRLRVTQGHCKRNHYTDHTRLSLLLVELFDVKHHRDLEMWVRGHSMSLKVVPFESLGAVSYLPSIVTMAAYL